MNAIIDAVGGSTATAWAPSDKVTYWITGRLLVSSANLKQDNFFFRLAHCSDETLAFFMEIGVDVDNRFMLLGEDTAMRG